MSIRENSSNIAKRPVPGPYYLNREVINSSKALSEYTDPSKVTKKTNEFVPAFPNLMDKEVHIEFECQCYGLRYNQFLTLSDYIKKLEYHLKDLQEKVKKLEKKDEEEQIVFYN